MLSSSAAVGVRRCRCHHPPLPLLLSAVTVVVVRCCCCPALPSSASAAVIATLCLRRLSLPALVHPLCSPPPNLACHCHLLLLLSLLSTAAIFCRRSHHHHSAVSTVSHCPLSSFPIAVRRPIACVVIVRHRCHPPPSFSAVAIPPLVLPPTRS